MFKNAEFQISFSDELHKIATSDSHPEAVALLKEAGNWGGMASKAWRSLKRFGRNPLLKSQQKVQEGRSYLGKLRATHAPTRAGRMKGRSQYELGQQGARDAVGNIAKKREMKIREIDLKHQGKAESQRVDQAIKDKKFRDTYQPNVESKIKADRHVRAKNLHMQRDVKKRNIEKAKVEESKLEVEKLKADAAAVKSQSIFTRVGGGLTSSGAPKSVKTVAGAAAIGVPAAVGYNLTMAEKKKKDNSIFKFGGKVNG